METKRIAVIGAGPSGLTAIKSCKEENVDVLCFERNGDPGGLWRYHDEDLDGVASVMKTTVINSSKEVSAFSDYPPPENYPNYMHHSKMYNYFMGYAKKFDLLKHIRYHQEVIEVMQTEDFDDSGRWVVKTKNSNTGEVSTDIFDGIMVCIGHHVFPKIPTFPGQEKFKGQTIHTHSLKSCEQFSGLRIVVVGIGNSGVDAAVDCAFVGKQVYLSTRRGSWVFPKSNPLKPTDTRWHRFLESFLTYGRRCSIMEKQLNARLDHEVYNLKPNHRVYAAHHTNNDVLPNCILSGRIVIKGNIDRFEENGVVFEEDDHITETDVVIFATGYQIKFPFLSKNMVKTEDNRVHLYMLCIPPSLKKYSLAILGLVQPQGPTFPISELQSRWFVQIIKDRIKLPDWKFMNEDIQKKNMLNELKFVESSRHTIQIDYLAMMDELASFIGAKPNLLSLLFTDPKLWWVCLTGPPMAYQYRLKGPHEWDGARDTMLKYEERIRKPLNTRCKHQMRPRSFDFPITGMIFACVAAIFVTYYAIFRI